MTLPEKNYLERFLKNNNLYKTNYTNIKSRISIEKSKTKDKLRILFCINNYYIGDTTVNSNSIFTIQTINSMLRDYKLPTIKGLGQNIIKNLILQLFKDKKEIYIKNISKKALTFWKKTINLLIKEKIIKGYKFEDYPNNTFENLDQTTNFNKKDYLGHIILFK